MKRWIWFLGILNVAHLQAGWLERKAEGWAWYEEKEKREQAQENEDLKPSPTLSAAQQAEIIRKNLEEKLAAAVIEPTPENVKAYMQEQQKALNQSAKFSEIWARVLLQDPSLDATLAGHPVSQYGIQVQKQIEQEERKALIKQLSLNYGLFFFYEGQSKVSQAFALVVKEFASKYTWEILAVSMDGHLLEGFTNNQINNGIAEKWNIQNYPALFLVNPKNKDIIPISFGLSSLDQIETNISLQFKGVGT